MSWDKKRKQREKEIQDLQSKLEKQIQAIQASLWTSVVDRLLSFDLSEKSEIKWTVGNMERANRIAVTVEQGLRARTASLITWIIRQVRRLLRVNTEYFEAVKPYEYKSVEERAAKLILRRLGYDTASDTLIAGGWFEAMTSGAGIKQVLARDLMQAITGKMTQAEFAKQFRVKFLGLAGQSYVTKHFETFRHDFFMSVDRAIALIYADELGLNYAIYAGTVMDTTRDFCERRVNKIYSREEILAWERLDWNGKKINHNIFLDLGGYRCRHVLSWISDEMAEAMKKR